MIENYAERAAPLTSIMNDKWSEAKGTMSEFWTDDCDKAFEDLKKAITTAPVLAINDPELPYVLQTDLRARPHTVRASSWGCAGKLSYPAAASRKKQTEVLL